MVLGGVQIINLDKLFLFIVRIKEIIFNDAKHYTMKSITKGKKEVNTGVTRSPQIPWGHLDGSVD